MKDRGLKNIKGDCSRCPDHGICAAEADKPNYFCPVTIWNEKARNGSIPPSLRPY